MFILNSITNLNFFQKYEIILFTKLFINEIRIYRYKPIKFLNNDHIIVISTYQR